MNAGNVGYQSALFKELENSRDAQGGPEMELKPLPRPEGPPSAEAPSITGKKIELFTPEAPSGSPQYQVSWKGVAALVGGVLLLALAAAALTVLFMSPPVVVPIMLLLAFTAAGGIMGSGFAFIGAFMLLRDQFLSDLHAHSQSLTDVPQKRAWLHKAALNGSREAVQEENEMILKLKEDLLDSSDNEEFEARLQNLGLWLDFTADTYGKGHAWKPKTTTMQDVLDLRKLYQKTEGMSEVCRSTAKQAFFGSIDTLDLTKKDDS